MSDQLKIADEGIPRRGRYISSCSIHLIWLVRGAFLGNGTSLPESSVLSSRGEKDLQITVSIHLMVAGRMKTVFSL